MIAGIADIIILVLVVGYCSYVIYKRHQDKKNGKGGCAGCSGCSGLAQDAALPSIRKRNKHPDDSGKKVEKWAIQTPCSMPSAHSY